ncbi:hypothetical protein PsorP6_009864 [Peronosclerospora sorghi]|uniref:Uncharacterized protein n=1 Tax=Peronosclerospora sorghi TaxID=230839 RepID=A0ACC0W0R6_9STRA|nr:hypothetical protein PsorP6_009864 [Peronosclerospora sorghi]
MLDNRVIARDAETKVMPFLQDESIISVLKRLLHLAAHTSLPSDNYPVLQVLLVDGEPPRLKKQKLAQDN